MTPERWQRVKALVHSAATMDAAARGTFLAEACAGDPEVRLEVERLLEETNPVRASRADTESISSYKPVFRADDLVSSRYRIVRFVAKGGMGEVYEATDLELGEVIALKTLLADRTLSEESLARFKREIQLGRKIIDPHVCRIYDLGRHLHPEFGDVLYLTMEFLRGETLSNRLHHLGRFSTADALPLVRQMVSALGAAHRLEIIHRDFKSSNVMLVPNADELFVKVTDFGLARTLDRGEGGPRTGSGQVMGTIAYMPPEQFRGEATKSSDIYALGVVMHEMVTGVRPFSAQTPVELRAAAAPRSHVPDLDSRWESAILRCLTPEAAARFASVEQVTAALTEEISPETKTATIPFPAPAAGTWRNYRATPALLVIILMATGVLFWRSNRKYTPSPAAVNWYAKGLEAFREGTFLKAAELFQSALNADRNFAVARAHLADSWNELDFKGKADEEMLAVSIEQENSVSPPERSYIEAVRATLGRDFTMAIRHFQTVLDQSAPAERAAGYVDLGRAYEKAGDIPAALDAYRQARRLTPDSPAAYVRSAALESRQGSDVEAANDFDRAYDLYTKLGSLEGDAEVAYQRSYWQTILHHFKEARELAQKSLDAARSMPIPSVQLEVRAMCRFSAIDHGGGNDQQAIDEATKAIGLAHENGLEYWETDALLRQGAAYLGKNDYAAAQNCFDKALKASARSHWPRLVALAQVNMATLRDDRRQPQDIQGLAIAMEYYRVYQFPSESLHPLLVLSRERSNRSQYADALQSALAVTALARKLRDPIAVTQGEEAIGTAYFGLQQYPDALTHFEIALDAANQANDSQTANYEKLHRAESLVSLGRFEEAAGVLRNLSNRDLAGEPDRIRAHMYLSQGRHAEVVQIVRRALLAYSDIDPLSAADFRVIGSMGARQASLADQARQWAEEAWSLAKKNDSAELAANASLARAQLELHLDAPQAAKSSAEAAVAFAEAHGQKESAWMGLFCLARAERALGNKPAAKQTAAKALDILRAFEHNWGTSVIQIYEKRPDVLLAKRELLSMSQS